MENREIIIPRPGNRHVLKQVSSPAPKPTDHQILIKNEAVGVAFADVLMREGLYPEVPKFNLTPGYDVVGTVVQVGNQVTSFSPGDRVLALTQTGGYAQYSIAEEALSISCPKELSATSAVSIILNYTTALQMLTRVAKVKPGESILVHGIGGGVGSALTEIALNQNINVYGTLSKRKWQELPAHIDSHPNLVKIDYQSDPFEQSLKKFPDVHISAAFDAIGGAHLKRTYRAIGEGGIAVSYGFSTAINKGRRNLFSAIKGLLQSTISPVQMIADNKALAGYGIWIYANAHPEWFREDLHTLVNWLKTGEIKPIINTVLPLEKVEEAHRLMETSQSAGKIVLTL